MRLLLEALVQKGVIQKVTEGETDRYRKGDAP